MAVLTMKLEYGDVGITWFGADFESGEPPTRLAIEFLRGWLVSKSKQQTDHDGNRLDAEAVEASRA